MAKCEGIRGGNVCGRFSEFLITERGTDNTKYSCADCVGRVIVENDYDEVDVERLYD